MGTISKALSKHKYQRKSAGEPPQADGAAKPADRVLPEAEGSGLDRDAAATDGAGIVLRQPRVESRRDKNRSLPAGPEAGPAAEPRPQALLRQVAPPVPEETGVSAGSSAENTSFGASPQPEEFDPKLVVVTRPYSFEAEQFKLLRSSLMFPSSGPPPRSVLVTSTDPGEGKTLVAANLAASIALNLDRYVLLIDCDLRRPYLHKLLGFEETPGLSEYLTGCCSLESLLLKTSLERFSFLAAGKIPVNPAELLNSDKMFKLMEEVRDRYADRLVIIDSPPPMLASESKALARIVDGVLLVIKHRSTKREDAAELVEKIGKDKILGTVMNFMDKQALGYYRSKKYGYKYYGQA